MNADGSKLRSCILILLLIAAICWLVPFAEAKVIYPEADDLDIPKIDLLLSGGGLRASAFAYGVLAGLNEICIPLSGDQSNWISREIDSDGNLPDCKSGYSSLLDRVNIISAVSGGAITAAFFKSHRKEFFEEFPKLLKKSDLKWRLLKAERPPTWQRLVRSPTFLLTSVWDTIGAFLSIPLSLFNLNVELTPVFVMALSDGLLESQQLTTVYKDLFFQNTRFEDLNASNGFPTDLLFQVRDSSQSTDSPMLLINATDIANGTVFTFDERTFACMGVGSEYGTVDLALAVAASSSLPGVFSPVRIDSLLAHADPLTIPSDCSPALADRSRKPVLVDGGVTDNLGAIGLLRKVIKRKEDFQNGSVLDSIKIFSDLSSHEHPGTKHLLLFINSEAESDSKLPGLAGHFDASYDVLIRSKKDLVRVIASDMFNHFGFGTVELRLSDLVTAELGVQTLTASEDRAFPQDGGPNGRGPGLIRRAFAATEQEARMLSGLMEVGMLPSANEIDTLIMAGRKIVRDRLRDLRDSFSTLEERTFDANCSNIVNLEQFFCWPDEFRAHDLESGGGSAFLQTVTQITNRFVATAIRERERLVDRIRDVALDKLDQENLIWEFRPGPIREWIENIFKGIVKEDDQLQQLYDTERQHLHQDLPCKNAFENLLEDISSDEEILTVRNKLRAKLRSVDCQPNYFLLLGYVEEMIAKNTGHSVDIPISVYYSALHQSDPNLNQIHIHNALGPLLIHRKKNFIEGLAHIEQSIALTKSHEERLQTILSAGKLASADREKATGLLFSMRALRLYSTMLRDQYIPLSPIPIPGSVGVITNEAVLDWERTHLRYSQSESLLEVLESKELLEAKEIPASMHAHLRAAQKSLANFSVGIKHLSSIVRLLGAISAGSHVQTDSTTPPLTELRLTTPLETCSIASPQKDQNAMTLGNIIKLVRCHIRAHLAESAGIFEGEQRMKIAYSRYLACESAKPSGGSMEFDCELYRTVGQDVLATYGLYRMIRSADARCPTRGRILLEAEEVISLAIARTATDRRLDHWRDLRAAMTDRFEAYKRIGTLLGCPTPNNH